MSRIVRRVRQAGVYFVSSRTWQSRAPFGKPKPKPEPEPEPEPAQILLEQLLESRARGFYKLHAFVIMPDHFHALLTPAIDASLEKVMQMIKGGSAHAMKQKLKYTGPIWQKGFHDRWIRNADEYRPRRHYIAANPVEARLAERAEEYPLSSACGKFAVDASEFD